MQLLENKIIQLVEERGYMGTKYIPVIRNIIDYIQSYILMYEKNTDNGWSFSLPSIYTDRIDCVENLVIEIEIIDKIDGYKHSGGGNTSVFGFNRIVNNKLEFGKICLTGYSFGTDLYARTIFGTFSHELNHVQEMYEKMMKKHTSNALYKCAVDQNTVQHYEFSKDNPTNKIIQDVFYRLMFKNELNALINSVYGDLETIGSVRENFKKDIKHTAAYNIYLKIKSELGLFNEDLLEDYEWDNIMKCYNLISVDGAKHYSNIKYFKKRFKNYVISKLNELMKGIGKIASFYYDNTEDDNLNHGKPIKMINPDIIINN